MLRTVRNYIEKQGLPESGAKVIVGLSGGADSVVLLSILHRIGYECIAAHCNFHLRGEESLRDEQLSAKLAASLSIPFYKQDFDTNVVAKERGISIEMAARDLRYEWFEELRKAQEAEAIAVAHHRDDSMETMLLNLIRGTGIAGLTGIKPKSGWIIRPLLCTSKEEILHYAAKKALPFVTDSSNLQDEFTRNKIRHQLLPLLQSLNPSLNSALLRTMEHLTEVDKIYNAHIKEAKEDVFDSVNGTINISGLLAHPSPEAILFEILKEYGFGSEVIQNVYQAIGSQAGKEFYSSNYRLIRDRTHFLLHPLKQKDEKLVFYIDKDEKERTFPLSMNISISEEKPEIVKDRCIACFDFDKLKFPLILRRWQTGDRFVPFGMNGSQKVSDYFNNYKFNKQEKENTWILCSGNDIIWVVRHRTDNRFKIDESSKRFFMLKLL
jgi:tRNA(Ile)-lysidine synthase